MRCLVNARIDVAAVPGHATRARAFHQGLPGYASTPVRELTALAAELGLARVAIKDESSRLGLPAFKVLGASWAVERALRREPSAHTLVAASAGNHGRAVARVAARSGLRCRIFLPARSAAARRAAIAGEGAEVVVVEGGYEDAVARAELAGREGGVIEIADVGDSEPARDVIDGYATLFAELGEEGGGFDLLVVPVGVGSLAAAAARYGAHAGVRVIGVEPASAACLTASLAAGEPAVVSTPGTTMAGLDCAEVSAAAWPSLHVGMHGMVTVSDAEARAGIRELAAAGLAIGDCGAATVAALRAIVSDPGCSELRAAAGVGPASRVMLIGTEGPTDPVAHRRVVVHGAAG